MRDRQTLHRIGARVRGLRNKRGMSLERLAERAGLTSKFVGEIERVETNPSATTLARLADALSVDVGHLFEPTDDILPVPATQMDELQEVYHSMGRAIASLLAPPEEGAPAARSRKTERPRGRAVRR